MKFQLNMIYGDGEYDESRPLSVHFTTDPVVSDRDDFIDLAAKHLRTFEAFQEVVADDLALWLDDPTTGRSVFERREEWRSLVSAAFDAGRRWKEQQNRAGEIAEEPPA